MLLSESEKEIEREIDQELELEKESSQFVCRDTAEVSTEDKKRRFLRKKEERGDINHYTSPSFAYKLLIFLISFVLFVLISVVVTVLLVPANVNLIEVFKQYWANSMVYGIIFITVLCSGLALLVCYILGILFSSGGMDSVYCRYFRRNGLILVFLFYVAIGLLGASYITLASNYPKTSYALMFVAVLISYIPVMVTWNIKDEERLKNFIDGISKTCSCMAFMGGAITLILKFYFG